MAAYFIADVDITDTSGFEEYRKLVPATIDKYGGRFIEAALRLLGQEPDGDLNCVYCELGADTWDPPHWSG